MTAAPSLGRRKLLAGGLGALALGSISVHGFRRAARAGGMATLTRAGMAFQTPVALTLASGDTAALEPAMDAAFSGIRAVENAASVYRPQSDLARLNREGRITAPHPHLVALVRYALDLARTTGGAFDPTVQPLWDVWSGETARGRRPTAEALRAVLRRVDWRGVTLTQETIRFDRPGMAMTLNSVNQGYAADVVTAILGEHGIVDAMVDTGEFGARGHHPSGRDWRLGVVAPRDTESLAFTLDPFRRFAATSGDYKTYFSPDFRDHHIFDPHTGYSPPTWSSITVTAPSGLEADGLSTALFVTSSETSRDLLASRTGCEARCFDKSGVEVPFAAI